MNVIIRSPRLEDGAAMTRLVEQSQTLDINSGYLYFLLATHFSQTCAVAECDGELIGFVTAYRLPQHSERLFIWQIAVSPAARGQGIALRLLLDLTRRDWFEDIRQIQCTISPANIASNGLFQKLAEQLAVPVTVSPFLTSTHLGSEHDDEPLVSLDLTARLR